MLVRLLNRHAIGSFVLAGLLISCTYLGITPADTFNKKWAATQQTDTAVLQSAFTLAQSDKITPDQLKKVEQETDNVQEALTLARTMHASNPTAGSSRLEQISAVLNALQSALASPDPGNALQTVPPLPTAATNN
jgi:hypothetical protein